MPGTTEFEKPPGPDLGQGPAVGTPQPARAERSKTDAWYNVMPASELPVGAVIVNDAGTRAEVISQRRLGDQLYLRLGGEDGRPIVMTVPEAKMFKMEKASLAEADDETGLAPVISIAPQSGKGWAPRRSAESVSDIPVELPPQSSRSLSFDGWPPPFAQSRNVRLREHQQLRIHNRQPSPAALCHLGSTEV
jgi:hypothetical protein